MRDEAGRTGEQQNHHIENGRAMSERLDREERAADWPDNGVDGVPRGIDPRNFVGKKFEHVQNAGEDNDPGLPETSAIGNSARERSVLWMARLVTRTVR